MKLSALEAAFGSAMLVLLSTPACQASSHHRHHHLHRKDADFQMRHAHSHPDEHSSMIERSGQCVFPTNDPDLVAVTPDQMNAGWAMSPDQPCKPNSYCPIACKPGMVMAQWDPSVTSYVYPGSMRGGLFCDSAGNIQKPFPDKPNCVQGTGTVKAVNNCGGQMSWCQTVLPGNEAMLIPTLVESEVVIAVPGPSYWAETAAHYYINPVGSGVEDCAWGTDSKAVGNWAAYVAGANTDSSGNTYVKIGMNPIYTGSGLVNTPPTFGLKIECSSGDCIGMPCSVSPTNGAGSVSSPDAATGAGGAGFCVVTVPPGGQAEIVAFNLDGSSGSSSSSSDSQSDSSTSGSSSSQSSSTPEPTSSSVSSTSTTSSTSVSTTASTPSSASASSTPTSSVYHEHNFPGIFHENDTSVSTGSSKPATTTLQGTSTNTQGSVAQVTTKKAEAVRQQGSAALAGLVIAFVATAYFF